MLRLTLMFHMAWLILLLLILLFLSLCLVLLLQYRSWIPQIFSSTYWFSFSLYWSNSLASILWIWNALLSMLLWIRYQRSSAIWVIFIVFVVRLLMLAVRIFPSISITVISVSSTIFFISFIILWTSIIASIPFNVLWYNLDQSSLSLFMICAWSMLFNFLDTYGFGDVGAVLKVLLFTIWEDILFVNK